MPNRDRFRCHFAVTSGHTWKNLHFYARKMMSMWCYRITRLLSRKYPELLIQDELVAEGSSKREWNRFLDSHYRRGWNVNVSGVMGNATHVAVYSCSYLKKPPVPMSRLEHYASQDEIGLLYNSHRTKREEYLLMSGDDVADKGFRMVRYYGFLSPAKRRLLEDVVYVITETVRKTARQITLRGIYQQLLKVDPLKCILCGNRLRFVSAQTGSYVGSKCALSRRVRLKSTILPVRCTAVREKSATLVGTVKVRPYLSVC